MPGPASPIVSEVEDKLMQDKAGLAAQFRNYESSPLQDQVQRTYNDIHTKQSVAYVQGKMDAYKNGTPVTMPVWKTVELLNQICDESDPDNDLPQHVHAFQTANSLVARYFEADKKTLKSNIFVRELFNDAEFEALPDHAKKLYDGVTLKELYSNITDWEWFPLVGLIHDLGKMLALPQWGSLPQWSVVGDTFPTGCKFQDANEFSEKGFYAGNPDAQEERYASDEGMYTPNCGLDKLLMSFGHDEYLAMVLEQSKTTFPPEAIYIIRFHSFYPWHTPKKGVIRGYQNLANDYDWKMLPLVRALQKADLYSKSNYVPSFDDVKQVYDYHVNKYFQSGELSWPMPRTE